MRWALRGMVAFAVLVSTAGQTAEAGTAEAADTTGSVEILIFHAVGDPDRLDFELTHPTGTYRSTDCGRQPTDIPDVGIWLCDDLPLGQYGLDLLGAEPDEFTTEWSCSDPDGFGYLPVVSAPTIARVDGDTLTGLEWSCRVMTSVPAVRVELPEMSPTPQFMSDVTAELDDGDGEPVSGCARTGVASYWCPVESPGSYLSDFIGIPDGYWLDVNCTSSGHLAASEEYGARAEVTVERPVWSCDAVLAAPLTFRIDPVWAPDFDHSLMTFEAVDSTGRPAGDCDWLEATDPGEGPNDVYGVCLNLADGTYRLDVEYPDEQVQIRCGPSSDSAEFVVNYAEDARSWRFGGCSVLVGSEPPPATGPSTTVSAPAPVVLLPPTGSTVNAAAIAALLLLGGLAMLVVSGGWRRSSAGRS